LAQGQAGYSVHSPGPCDPANRNEETVIADVDGQRAALGKGHGNVVAEGAFQPWVGQIRVIFKSFGPFCG